jgi:hypothetical protein
MTPPTYPTRPLTEDEKWERDAEHDDVFELIPAPKPKKQRRAAA